jgi:hypothetical protein
MPTPIPIPVLDASASVRTCGRQNDPAYSVLLLADGSFPITGQANNAGLSHRITPGNARLIRTDAEGNVLREKDCAGEIEAAFCSLVQVGEDEHVAQGCIAASYERDETDFYLVKVDGEGHEIRSQTYGGYVMAGDTHRGGVPATGEASHTGLIVKPDADGEILWRHI